MLPCTPPLIHFGRPPRGPPRAWSWHAPGRRRTGPIRCRPWGRPSLLGRLTGGHRGAQPPLPALQVLLGGLTHNLQRRGRRCSRCAPGTLRGTAHRLDGVHQPGVAAPGVVGPIQQPPVSTPGRCRCMPRPPRFRWPCSCRCPAATALARPTGRSMAQCGPWGAWHQAMARSPLAVRLIVHHGRQDPVLRSTLHQPSDADGRSPWYISLTLESEWPPRPPPLALPSNPGGSRGRRGLCGHAHDGADFCGRPAARSHLALRGPGTCAPPHELRRLCPTEECQPFHALWPEGCCPTTDAVHAGNRRGAIGSNNPRRFHVYFPRPHCDRLRRRQCWRWSGWRLRGDGSGVWCRRAEAQLGPHLHRRLCAAGRAGVSRGIPLVQC